MRSWRETASGAVVLLASMTPLIAQPSQDPEQAAVFIDVQIESRDAATGQPRLAKVAEGSGFLIHRSGWVITAAHVTKVEIPEGATLRLQGSVRSRYATKFPLEVLPHGQASSDVALLKFPAGLGTDFPYLCVVKHPSIANGDKITALGFPLGFDLSVRPGAITSLVNDKGLVQGNMGLARGMSGGPVVDERRAVIGVIHGGIEGQSSFDYFTPTNLALPVFDTPPASYVGDSCQYSQQASAHPAIIERSYQIDETYDEHPGLAPTSKEYRITKAADPGHKIVDARVVRQSDTRVSDLVTSISPDRRSVELKFRLTAGPIFDRWRGWLHGQLILTMQPAN